MIWTIFLIVLMVALIAVVITAFCCWANEASFIEFIFFYGFWIHGIKALFKILGYLILALLKSGGSGSDSGCSSSGGDW